MRGKSATHRLGSSCKPASLSTPSATEGSNVDPLVTEMKDRPLAGARGTKIRTLLSLATA